MCIYGAKCNFTNINNSSQYSYDGPALVEEVSGGAVLFPADEVDPAEIADDDTEDEVEIKFLEEIPETETSAAPETT